MLKKIFTFTSLLTSSLATAMLVATSLAPALEVLDTPHQTFAFGDSASFDFIGSSLDIIAGDTNGALAMFTTDSPEPGRHYQKGYYFRNVTTSPDGSMFFTNQFNDDGLAAKLISTATGETLFDYTSVAQPASFSADGSRLSYTSHKRTVQVTNTNNGNALTVASYGGDVYVAHQGISPDGETLIVVYDGGTHSSLVRYYDVLTQDIIQDTDFIGNDYGHDLVGPAFIPGTDDFLFCAAPFDKVERWNTSSTGSTRDYDVPGLNEYYPPLVTADGQSFLVVTGASTIKSFSLETGDLQQTYTINSGEEVSALMKYKLSGDGTVVGALYQDKQLYDRHIELIDIQTGDLIHDYTYQPLYGDPCFSPDGGRMFSPTRNGVAIIDTKTHTRLGKIEITRDVIDSMDGVRISGDGSRLLVGGYGNSAVYDATIGTQIQHFPSTNDSIGVLSHFGDLLYKGTNFVGLAKYSVATGELLHTYYDADVSGVTLSPDDSTVVGYFFREDQMRFYNAHSGEETHNMYMESGGAPSFSPDGKYFMYYNGNEAKVFNTSDWSEAFHRYIGGTWSWWHLTSASITPDSKHLIMCEIDRSGDNFSILRVYNIETGEEVVRCNNAGAMEGTGTNKIIPTPDGKYVYCTGGGSLFEVWDLPLEGSVPGPPVTALQIDTPLTEHIGQFRTNNYELPTSGTRHLLVEIEANEPDTKLWGLLRKDALPSVSVYDDRALEPAHSGKLELLCSPTDEGYVYISVYGQDTLPTGGTYTIKASYVDHHISSVAPDEFGNSGAGTLNVRGLNFGDNVTFQLSEGATALRTAQMTDAKSGINATTKFDFSGMTPEVRDLVGLWDSSPEYTLINSITINAGQGGEFFASIYAPSTIRGFRTATGLIIYGNTGTNDIPAQLLQVSIDEPGDIKPIWDSNYRNLGSITLLATGGQSPIGTIVPDDLQAIAFNFKQGVVEYGELHLDVLDDGLAAINWDDFKDTMQPDNVDQTEWNTLWDQLKPTLGSTWAEHTQILLEKAEILRLRGQSPQNPRGALELLAREAAGEPIAAVTGHLYDSLTGKAITSAKVKAHATDNSFFKTSVTDAEDGHLIIDYIPDGDYELFVEGYIVEIPSIFTITDQIDVLNQTWFATPVEEEEELEPIDWNQPAHHPTLVAGDDGSLHLMWKSNAQLHYSSFANDSWADATVVEDTEGAAPTLAWGQIDTGSGVAPGLVAVWETGSGTERHLVWATANYDATGTQWSESTALTGTDAVPDYAPRVFIDDAGIPQVLWLQCNNQSDDDPDVYFTSIAPSKAIFTEPELLALAEFDQKMKDSQICRIWKLKQGKKLPKKIPLIGGKYGFELTGELCGDRDCQLVINGELAIQVDFSKNFSGGGKVFGEAVWITEKEQCIYVFDSAVAGMGLNGTARLSSPPVPIVILGIPLGEASVFGQLTLDLAGEVEWKSNFPGNPTGGNVSLTGGLTPGGELELFGGGLGGEVSGTVSVTGKYTPPSKFELTKYCVSLNGEAYILYGIVAKRWEKKWGPCAAEDKDMTLGQVLSSSTHKTKAESQTYMMDDVLIFEGHDTYMKMDFEGTGNVYEGSPLVGPTAITSDLYADGIPSVASLASSLPDSKAGTEALTVWVKEDGDYDTALGAKVVASWRRDGEWSTPQVIDDEVAISKDTAVVTLPNGNALAVWSKATTDTTVLNSTSSLDDILDTMERADIYYSLHDGISWSIPAPVSTIDGRDEAPVLTVEADGTVTMAWLNNLDSTVSLFTAHWDGTDWTTPLVTSTSASMDKPAISTVGSEVFLVWAQDGDNDLDTWDDWNLLYSRKTTGTWSTPGNVLSTKTKATKPGTSSPAGLTTVASAPKGMLSPPSSCCAPDAEPFKPYHATIPAEILKKIKDKTFNVVAPHDPNEKIGPDDQGDVHFNDDPFIYTIYFENIETATAAAQVVQVVDNLSDSLDWNTFTPIDVGFGDISIPITAPNPDGSFAVSTLYTDVMTTEPTTYQAQVSGALNRSTGQLKWTFETIDPQTGELPEDVYAGFLPPNDDTGRGQGHVSFMIHAKQGLEPFTLVTNEAIIVFDQEAPIITNKTRHVVSPYSATEILRHLIDEQILLEGMDTNDDTFVDDADYIEVINLLNGE